MKSSKPKKAPKVPIPSRDKPNVMKEADNMKRLKSPMAPMKSKRLSK
jgi:hypothetical protein